MTVVKTYWALPVEESKPFQEVAHDFIKGRIDAYDTLLNQIGCDEINTTNSGSILLTYTEKQSLPWLYKKPAFVNSDGYHYFTKANTDQDKLVSEARRKIKELVSFYDYCSEKFPDTHVSIIGESLSHRSGFPIYETSFGILKGQLVMMLPVQSENPDYSKVPAGFVELSNSQYAALIKVTQDDSSTE